jgi:hypothetical protein
MQGRCKNPFVEAFTAKTDPQTLNDLYSKLLLKLILNHIRSTSKLMIMPPIVVAEEVVVMATRAVVVMAIFVVDAEEVVVEAVATRFHARFVERSGTLHYAATNTLMHKL